MAIDHATVQPTVGKSVLYTVPAGTPPTHVTIQNRSTIDIAVGDYSLSAVTGTQAGVLIAAGGSLQTFLNSNDTIYAYTSTAFSGTNVVAILGSYVSTTGL